MDRHDAVKALLTDYVLGEMNAAGRRDVETHLASCVECATETRELAHAFHHLALAAPAATAPSALRERVLAEFPREHAAPSGAVGDGEWQTRRASSPLRYWLAAAAVVILGLGTLLAVSYRRTAEIEEALTRVRIEEEALQDRLATIAGQGDLAVAILTAPDMRRVDLTGVDASRGAVSRAYWSQTRGLLIVADRLPAPPPGRGYQVWLIAGSAPGPVSAGMLAEQGEGRGMLIVPPPEGIGGGAVTIAVTDEPDGGRPAPTGGKHLLGSI